MGRGCLSRTQHTSGVQLGRGVKWEASSWGNSDQDAVDTGVLCVSALDCCQGYLLDVLLLSGKKRFPVRWPDRAYPPNITTFPGCIKSYGMWYLHMCIVSLDSSFRLASNSLCSTDGSLVTALLLPQPPHHTVLPLVPQKRLDIFFMPHQMRLNSKEQQSMPCPWSHGFLRPC